MRKLMNVTFDANRLANSVFHLLHIVFAVNEYFGRCIWMWCLRCWLYIGDFVDIWIGVRWNSDAIIIEQHQRWQYDTTEWKFNSCCNHGSFWITFFFIFHRRIDLISTQKKSGTITNETLNRRLLCSHSFDLRSKWYWFFGWPLCYAIAQQSAGNAKSLLPFWNSCVLAISRLHAHVNTTCDHCTNFNECQIKMENRFLYVPQPTPNTIYNIYIHIIRFCHTIN